MALTVAMILAALWSYAIPMPPSTQQFTALYLALWFGQQLAWWGLISVLLAVIGAQLVACPPARTLLGWVGWHRAAG